MPYYLETDDRDLLKKLLQTHVCAVCSGKLEALYDPTKHLPYLQCKDHPEHEGIGKPNRKENNDDGGLRQMAQVEQQHGLDKARNLVKYQGVTSLTRPQAMEILETIWPEAPAIDKVAAAIMCTNYGLNPLANHVFLIKFHNAKKNNDEWARVWGIKAKRLIASRKGGYSYLDMTPRLMTEAEQIKVWGAVDKANISFITILKDMTTGAEAFGFGKWPNDKEPHGTEKGNTKENMASIRSESQALDRLRPAEMPTGFVVADEQYIEGEGRDIPEPASVVNPEPLKDASQATLKAGEVESGIIPPREEQQPSEKDFIEGMDVDWFKTSFKTLNFKDATIKSFIKSKANFQGLSIEGNWIDVLRRMNLEQKIFFDKWVHGELEKKELGRDVGRPGN